MKREMARRRIVTVLEWFDEEQDLPWSFIERSRNECFRAVTTYLRDFLDGENERGASGEAVEHSLGEFKTHQEAVDVLKRHLERVEIACLGDSMFNYTVH